MKGRPPSTQLTARNPFTQQVALKMHRHVGDPHGSLRREAEMHAKAWARLNHVLKPYGFLAAHEATDTPAILVMEIGV